MDYCTGNNEIVGDYHYFRDDELDDHIAITVNTYCNFCVENKCVDSSKLSKTNTSDHHSHIKCMCPNKKKHPCIVYLVCPTCYAKNIDSKHLCITGLCKNCGDNINYVMSTYCDKCSFSLKSCFDCGNIIKNGNHYISEIEKMIANEYLVNEKYNSYFHKVKINYMNKTEKEMLELIIREQRKLLIGV